MGPATPTDAIWGKVIRIVPPISPTSTPPMELSEEVAAKLESLAIRRGTYTLEPLNRIQKFIAARLTEAARDIPAFPLSMDIAADTLLALRLRYNEASGSRISVNDLMIKACALALQEVPAVNSSFTPLGFVRHRHADIAVAVATDQGLMTPIVFAAEEKGIARISAEAHDLKERARAQQLRPDEYTGGTFTISNLGMFGITSFASIINPPHAAILSIGAARANLIAGEPLRSMTSINVTLTCDHRVIDGVIGARWLNAFRGHLERPDLLVS
jgi:pyruvate dehydrogenase E2 component (dihydrolipoamide acetyltransferase)